MIGLRIGALLANCLVCPMPDCAIIFAENLLMDRSLVQLWHKLVFPDSFLGSIASTVEW